MLLMRSRTEAPLGFSAEPPAAVGLVLFSLLVTLVTSPDLRSTPTIDQGRGFGKGLGFAAKLLDVESSLEMLERGLASGDGEFFLSNLPYLVERRPTIEPPLSSFFSMVSSPLLDLSFVVGNSLVGEVKLAANPVDLKIELIC